MKCPACTTKHRHKLGLQCGCGYQFALDPKQDHYTDGKLLAAVRKASAGNTTYFTFPQLATAVVGLRKSRAGLMVVTALLLLFGSCLFWFGAEWIIAAAITFLGALGLISCIVGEGRLNTDQLRKAVEKYEASKQNIPFLLRDDRPLATPPIDWQEDDIYDYGVEGILIVQRPLLVDLFVMNGQHAAHRVLIVSESGYPEYIVPHVNRILEEQPTVPVFVLHDASKSGSQMVVRLKESRIFDIVDHRITDLGMHSSELHRTPKLRQFESKGEVAVDHLTWNRLSSGIGAAMVGGIALVDVIGRDPEASSMMSFG